MRRLSTQYHILVVEDSPEVSEAFVLLLQEEGYHVRAAANGRVALEALRRERPCLVFVDLVMPELNGFELIDEMKRDATLADIPVVAVTASNYVAEGVETLKKPFRVNRVLETAKHYCAEN
ncbi:MAG TPA: response regulator [Polyangiaceae bacterium]|nr:response regulator [Polyangiaceae bacterium]